MRQQFTSNISQAEIASLAEAVKAYINALGGGAVMKLYDNNFTPTPAAVLSQFHEASFAGYAAYPMTTWQAQVFRNLACQGIYCPGVAGFQAAGGVVPVFIYGWYVVDAATELLLAAWGRFDEPEQLVVEGDTILVPPFLRIPFAFPSSHN